MKETNPLNFRQVAKGFEYVLYKGYFCSACKYPQRDVNLPDQGLLGQ